MTPAAVLSASLAVLTIFGCAVFAVMFAQMVAWFASLDLTEYDRKFLRWSAAFVVAEVVLRVMAL